MNAIEIYEKAVCRLDHNEITVGEFEAEIAVLKDVEPAQKWIPVTESLPGICEPVLVCCDFMGGKAFRVSDRYGKNGMLWTGVPQSQKVTHWMPLPEPPKEDTP